MRLKTSFTIWSALTLLMLLEYLTINHLPQYSLLHWVQRHFHLLAGQPIQTKPGRSISYFLGWTGFGTILLTNLYIFRKRLGFMNKWGSLKNWMGFHILCGLMGPTFIIFHSDFKVRGLVAISFWSMMVVAVSGVMGGYFYVQSLKHKKQLEDEAQKWSALLTKMRDKTDPDISDEVLSKLKVRALKFAGGGQNTDEIKVFDFPFIFLKSLIGDIKLLFTDPPTHPRLPEKSRIVLSNYAVAARKIELLSPFQRMLSYWHTFHIPFAFAMYVTAVIHIIVASIFLA